ncbi:hypothetical protein K491DRAFT_698718 [Lophiostoma macrostomum CBS 122681]|uniref:Peptidase S33 tripeptidyl aminopeptidase-like C-terminal domain-containing protein n=1 Tax=Lophiostoma macrostomum CBS 122681 TaxID=1314788 RepID=A0A6A6SNZ0_9PLEO|nr:hypothetical protein K491DRAFT_698718 [Lophiostoma macrostomum CBS 122681]
MKSWSEGLVPTPKEKQKERVPTHRWVIATLVVLIILLGSDISPLKWPTSYNRSGERPATRRPFRWDSIDAKDTLDFHPCDDFQCAKLKLPLDYFNGTYPDETISVALVKLPAKVSVDDPRYGGPILINPGGPGGPGALAARLEGKQLQTIVDSPDDPSLIKDPVEINTSSSKYFDIIGFDPRGVGETRPLSSCIPDGAAQWSWGLREASEGIIESSDAALGRLWSMNQAWGTSCSRTMASEDGPDIKQYMTTAFVVRDMVEIIERHAEFVSKKAADSSEVGNSRRSRCNIPEIATYKPGTAQLQYIGFSYGTYLGATFASMHPERVGRVILDGVVNSDDYNYSLGNGSLVDTEKAMKSFYTFCLLSGPDACPLTTSADSLSDIESRVQSIIQSLYHNPIPLASEHGPEVLTFTDLKLVIFSALYQPQLAFPIVAKLLAAVEARGGPMLDLFAEQAQEAHIYQCSTGLRYSFLDVAVWAILCADGEDVSSETIREFQEYWNLLNKISPTSGSVWTINRLKCAHWKIRPTYRYKGRFGGNTTHPILWLSNTADPVTPLRSARIMSERFPGSVVLTQDAAGHCVSSAASPCAIKHVRHYFQTGELPEPNTICIPPSSPFSLNSTDPASVFYDDSTTYTESMDTESLDCATTHAVQHLQEWFAEQHNFGHVPTKERVKALLASTFEESLDS